MLRKFIFNSVFLLLAAYLIVTNLNKQVLTTNSNAVEGVDDFIKDYCIQNLADEVSTEYEEEMLKVQAILVRTTLYADLENIKQDYVEKEIDPIWLQTLERVWDETEGQVVMYEDQLALVPFHQISNGKTRSGEEVLGSEAYPYLQVVECPEDVGAENQLSNLFIPETDVMIEEWDSAGYVLSVTIGDKQISGENFRDIYDLSSSCFEVQSFENQTRVITKGVGHGLGLSQYTANAMAKNGKTYQEILQRFYPGTEIKEVAEILRNIE